MHIILISDKKATTRSVTLTRRHIIGGIVGLFLSLLVMAAFFSYITVRHAAEFRLSYLTDLIRVLNLQETQKNNQFMRDNLNAMAGRVGQLQAELMRLDSQTERISAMAGVKPPNIANKDARGGPLVDAHPLSTNDLQAALDALANDILRSDEKLSTLETRVFDAQIKKRLLPTSLPIDAAEWNSSSYGWRIDPVTGERAFHQGIDIPAEIGTPIHVASTGVVLRVEQHPLYGLFVDIDHGDNLVTRYAHTSAVLVEPGQLVKRGQVIAKVGNSGRTTGPHLHFEVRVNDVAQNPMSFLTQPKHLASKH